MGHTAAVEVRRVRGRRLTLVVCCAEGCRWEAIGPAEALTLDAARQLHGYHRRAVRISSGSSKVERS